MQYFVKMIHKICIMIQGFEKNVVPLREFLKSNGNTYFF